MKIPKFNIKFKEFYSYAEGSLAVLDWKFMQPDQTMLVEPISQILCHPKKDADNTKLFDFRQPYLFSKILVDTKFHTKENLQDTKGDRWNGKKGHIIRTGDNASTADSRAT